MHATDAGVEHDRACGRRWDVACLVLLLLVSLVPVWAFGSFASTDGPSHVYNANAIAHYLDEDCSAYGAAYGFNRFPVPNWTGHLLIAAFATVAPPVVAEKLFVSLYVLLLPLAMLYAVTAVGRRGQVAALLVFPWVHGTALLAGWYNFSLSLALLLLLIGFWRRRSESGGRGTTAGLFGLFLLLYLSHPVTLGAGLLAVVLLALHPERRAVARDSTGRPSAALHSAWRRLRVPLLCAAPFVAAVAVFAMWNEPLPLPTGGGFAASRIHVLLNYFLTGPMGPLQSSELRITLGYVALLWILFAVSLRRTVPGRSRAILWLFLAFVALSLVVPDRFGGGGNYGLRFATFAWLTLVLWIGSSAPGRRGRLLMRVAPVLAVLAQLLLRAPTLAQVAEYRRGMSEAAVSIDRGASFLPIELHPVRFPRPYYVPILARESASYPAAERCLVDVSNYEVQLISFPLTARPRTRRVYRDDVSLDEALVRADVPWLLVSAYPPHLDAEARGVTERRLRRIQLAYDLVARSERGGLHRVYRRRAATSGGKP